MRRAAWCCKDFARQRTTNAVTDNTKTRQMRAAQGGKPSVNGGILYVRKASIPKLKPDPYPRIRCTVYDQRESCPNSRSQRVPRTGSPSRLKIKIPSYQPLDGANRATNRKATPAAAARAHCCEVFRVEKIAGPSH